MFSLRYGRPPVDVSLTAILDLRRLNYTWSKISSILGISRSTLYRRLEEAGISPTDNTPLSNGQVDEIVVSIKADHPNDGEVLLQGHLFRMGIRISRQAVRNSIHRVDHEGAVARRRSVIRRRIYSVPHPNYIWHIDSHHKLIRWRFVVHGAIDGFSRTILYLNCADNNRAETVLHYFQQGVSQYGLPEYIRSDHGGENVDVWRYIIANHSLDYSRAITGSSVHNERIERLWRDVNRCVVSIYADTFRDMERSGYLDPLNEVDLYCLHYIYEPLINKCITEFKESWNNHSMSTEGSMSPHQLFFEGIAVIESQAPPSTSVFTNVQIEDAEEHVVIPRIRFVPCSFLLQQIYIVNPLQSHSCNATSLFRRVLHIVGQHLCAQCNQCRIV